MRMKRNFAFKWYANTRYGSPIERTNLVLVSGTGDIGSDAKSATDVFCKTFGNLKKNTIVSIQELDEKGTAIGEPIIPSDEVVTVPVKKN
jgi:hypothetical protein